ncbi:MAG: hypothetical protein LBV45_06340 [Xanthomonadaceae bacterium]|jgi:hypothetical protein|nr:hypothetical protein [Xanthomonadaceae bacterium]
MYEQHLKFNFSADASHETRLSFVAELAQRHPKYFWYTIEHSPSAQCGTFIVLQPGVWSSVLATAQTAQAGGLIQIVSPKQYRSATCVFKPMSFLISYSALGPYLASQLHSVLMRQGAILRISRTRLDFYQILRSSWAAV